MVCEFDGKKLFHFVFYSRPSNDQSAAVAFASRRFFVLLITDFFWANFYQLLIFGPKFY